MSMVKCALHDSGIVWMSMDCFGKVGCPKQHIQLAMFRAYPISGPNLNKT